MKQKQVSKEWLEVSQENHSGKTSLARVADFNRIQIQMFYNKIKRGEAHVQIVRRQTCNMDTHRQFQINYPKFTQRKGRKYLAK